MATPGTGHTEIRGSRLTRVGDVACRPSTALARVKADDPRMAMIDVGPSGAESPLRKTSLPPAGFRVYRACNRPCAIEQLTTHRAEPSWT